MKQMKSHMELLGYQCIVPKLPLTYKEFDYAAIILEGILEKLFFTEDEKVHLVGHSTGGLVIRKLISDTKYVDKIGRCVLIGTPNKGSKLANIAGKMKPVIKIFKTLRSLDYDYIEQIHLTSRPDIEIAAIAGNRNKLLLGKLIGEENDGRVEVDSVYYPELKDYITLPYGHTEIHHQPETAKLIDAFIRTGKFFEKELKNAEIVKHR